MVSNPEKVWRAALVDALQDGLYVVDAAGDVIEINGAFTEVLGYGPGGLPYPVPHPWWPDPDTDPADFTQVVEALAAVRATGGGRFRLPLRHRDGRRIWGDCSATTVYDTDGNGPVIVGVVRDVTAENRAAERDRLLAETGRLLIGTARLGERLTGFATLVVPVLADLAVVSLIGPDGRLVAVAAAHRDRPELAEAVLAGPPQAVPAALADARHDGRAFVLDPPGAPGSLVAPLAAPGRLLGALTLVSTAGPRTHDDLDLALAEELGRRLTGVIEADRVSTREQQLHAITTALAAAGTVTEAAAVLGDGVRTALGATGIAVYVTQADDPQQLRLAHTSGYPPEVAETFALVHVGAALPVAEAARTGEPLWLGESDSWLLHYPHMAVAGAAEETHALAALPLRVEGRVVGVLVASFPSERAFQPDERSFALTMVGQAAQAFERAATADARWLIAQTLQRSLLPASLPALPRLALAAHYLPAGQHTAAGGDWYDVTVLDADHVAIAVGDVVGHGSRAAAVMGQLRSALSAYLLESHAPAHALQWLNRFARGVEGARGSTAICLVLNTATGELRWARAGHPPPLVLDPADAGTARFLDDAEGAVLGLTGAPPITEGRAVLTVGCTVLLYTDGLVERRGEAIDDGLDRLAAAASAHLAPARLVPAVLHEVLRGDQPADDVAVIAARFRPGPLEQRLPAEPAQLPRLRRAVAVWAAATALPAEQLDDLQLSLGEAVANAVEHAYPGGRRGEVTVRLEQDADGSVGVQVRDRGTWRPPPADPGYRGRGLAMIGALGADVTVDITEPGTAVRFTLPAPAPDPARLRAPGVPVPTPQARLGHAHDAEGRLRLELTGELDLTTAGALRGELLDRLAGATGPVTIDTRGITYLASAGVGLLLEAVDAAPDRLQLQVTPGSPAARILVLTGLADHRSVHPAP